MDMTENTKINPAEASFGEPIFAWATPPGRSGVAVLRLSGPSTSMHETLTLLGVCVNLQPRKAHLVTLKHQNYGVIDQALALSFPAPQSFTGEACLEFHTHGSRAVVRLLTELLLESGIARMAEPGEFAKRAFRNGKMDLLQAEGLADLLEADTLHQHKQSLALVEGHITTAYEAIRSEIIKVRAHVEAYIDFPDEDIPEDTMTNMRAEVSDLISRISTSLDDNGVSEKIREGIRIAIIGPPNAGKSTLLNALARRDVAITSAEAGTTRDALEITLDIGGYPVILVDTAGLREADSAIEAEGIKRSRAHAQASDLHLGVFDCASYPCIDTESRNLAQGSGLFIFTKSDLHAAPEIAELDGKKCLSVSLLEAQSVEHITAALKTLIEEHYPVSESPLVIRARHRDALKRCIGHLESFLQSKPNELLAEDLRLASREIEKITGKIELDAILDVLFGSFCIGK